MADSRVTAAIGHWAPRFIANGIDYSDFVAVTSKISTWDSWCEQWCQAGAMHAELGRFMFVDDIDQMRAAHMAAVKCLDEALPFLDPPGERVEIPFDGSVIAGVLRRPAGSRGAGPPGPYPLVVLIPGLDSAKEEFRPTEDLFLSRGLATLSIDGPGQGEAEYDLPIRPDWEVPGAAVIDAASELPGIDPDRIGIWGVSLGGYYAARVVAGDKRVRAALAKLEASDRMTRFPLGRALSSSTGL